MLADTAILSTSPWQTDQFLSPEVLQLTDTSDVDSLTFDVEVAELEAQIDRMRKENEVGYSFRNHSQSCGTSVASSECSDELATELDENASVFSSMDNSDYFSSSLLSILTEESTEPDPDPFPSLSWLDIELVTPTVSKPQPAPLSQGTRPPDKQTTARKKKSAPPLAENKPWSSLSSKEQVSVVESLTEVISRDLGLREQLEIIRMISPQASVAASDTEFVIDLNCFNDEKLHRVREYIRQHSRTASTTTTEDRCCSSAAPPTPKKQTKRQQRSQQRERRQRQRKEYRQMMKEKRSGLFGKEEVLALSLGDPYEQDIDILT